MASDDRAIVRIGLVLEPSTPQFSNEDQPAEIRDLFLLQLIDLGLADDRLKTARVIPDADPLAGDAVYLR